MEKARSHNSGSIEIPSKLYFRIGEVSDIVGVKPYVLRYWESEFPDIKPSKSKSGQRLYKRRDVELLLRIRQLLYEERFTINGARKRLREWGRGEAADPVPVAAPAPVPTTAQKGAPRQIEAFPEEQAEGESAGGEAGRVGYKTLKKIRRDLEELLTVIQG